MASFSASEAAFEGFRLIRARPLSVFIWGLVTVLALLAIVALIWILIGPQLQQALITGFKNGGTGGGSGNQFNIGSGPVAILIDCAIFRALLRPAERSFASLRISGDELRVFGVVVGLSILFVLAAIVTVIVAAIPLVILYNSGLAGVHAITILLAVLLGIAAFLLVIWVGVRMCLTAVITFAERRLALFDSWRMTRGHFWSLLGTALLSWLMAMAVMFGAVLATAIICLVILAPVLGDLSGSSPNYAKAMPFMIGAGSIGVIALTFLISINRVIMTAPLAYVYRALCGVHGESPTDESAQPLVL